MEQPFQPPTTILVADDDATCRLSLAELLEDEGYAVLVASDGASALRLFEIHTPPVVLTDLEMPRARGDEVIRAVLARRPQTLTILVSGNRTAQARRWAADAGASAFLVKPLEVDAVLRQLGQRRTPAVEGW